MSEKLSRNDRDFLFLTLLRSELGNLELLKKELLESEKPFHATLDVRIVLLRQLIEIYLLETEVEMF